MKPEAIFAPVGVLALWTGLVLFLTGCRRIRAVVTRRLSRGAFRLGESPEVPENIAVFNRNLMNLLELPVLFYVACLALYVTHQVGTATLALAWIYVGLRLVHSMIHLTYNKVVHRLVPFAASNFVLLAIWLKFLWRIFLRG
jgi:hypothetical protein